jgi:hypothetical protein
MPDMVWFKRSKQAFAALKRYADDISELPTHRPLDNGATGEGLVYTVNPVYLEAGQGGNSYLRGFGSLIFLFGFVLAWWMAISQLFVWLPQDWIDPSASRVITVFMTLFMLFATALASLVTFAWVGTAFLAPVDVITRYDRKRQKVWVWNAKGPIELDWNALVPVVRGTAASAYLPTKLYRGLYVEFGDDGRPRKTRGVPHVVQVGQTTADPQGVLPVMEYVREYMEQGPQVLPPVLRYLRRRPRWWMMFNFAGIAEDWADHFAGRPLPLGPPYGTTIAFIVLFPVLFPLQITNWLALMLAPWPKWPKDLLRTHQQDLADLAVSSSSPTTPPAASSSPTPRRKPVIRVNGNLVDDAHPDGE